MLDLKNGQRRPQKLSRQVTAGVDTEPARGKSLKRMLAMARFNAIIGWVFLGFMAVGFAYLRLTGHHLDAAPADAMLSGA
jgi:hypothetical protein